MTTTPLIIIPHFMIVTDLTMTINIENFLHEQIILPAQITILNPFVAHINITLVLTSAPLVIITYSSRRYILPYRSPSEPRIDRYRSRSHSNSNKLLKLPIPTHCSSHSTITSLIRRSPSTEIKFEIIMYHPSNSS